MKSEFELQEFLKILTRKLPDKLFYLLSPVKRTNKCCVLRELPPVDLLRDTRRDGRLSENDPPPDETGIGPRSV